MFISPCGELDAFICIISSNLLQSPGGGTVGANVQVKRLRRRQIKSFMSNGGRAEFSLRPHGSEASHHGFMVESTQRTVTNV